MTLESKVKKRRVSKKTKRSWRKNISHEDVESYFEKTREDERLGDVSRRKNSELFRVEVKPQILSKRQRREIEKSREPRCFEILKPHSSVPDPIAKRNVPTKPKVTFKSKSTKTSRKTNLADKVKKIRDKNVRVDFDQDVWSENNENRLESSWLSKDAIKQTFGPIKKRIPSSLKKKPSVLPAIDVPHPGASYNPSYEDHQDLLRIVANKETEERKKEEHLNRVTSKMFSKVSQAEKEQARLKELSEGLNLNPSTSDPEDSDENSTEVKSVNPPVKNLKKTRQQRRKQRLEKEMQRKRLEAKEEKRKITDVYRLRFLEKQLAKEEKKKTILREKRLKKKALKELEPKVLCKTKFEPADPDFQLSEQLSGSLRAADPTGNLLKDRFKSLQQRNIVAPSTLQLKITKAKKKRFIKPDHKIDLKQLKSK